MDAMVRRKRLIAPIIQFIHTEASSGVILLIVTVGALVWANSPWANGYTQLWQTPVFVGVGANELKMSAGHWINDGLMAVFFLLVGLEIKRELLSGELSSARKAALPFAAAIGGMIAPALLYAALNRGTDAGAGWGIPMATDIAFALGVLALAGSRVPLGLKVFLVALAIVDDLGAVLVIALFYTSQLQATPLLWAAALVGGLLLLNRMGVRSLAPYLIAGGVLWLLFLASGVHATIAGVALAATIPAKGDESPLQKLEDALHPWVTFGVMPVFAFANAGVPLGEGFRSAVGDPIAHGIGAGLLLGKPLGIVGMAWLAVKLKFAELPESVGWRHIVGAGILGGVGFTMSLFIAELGLTDPTHLLVAKTAILGSSVAAGVVGFILLRRADEAGATRRRPQTQPDPD